ncbi:MAG: three-Cys-motif partner protein TcmP [bacterium]
MAAPRTTIWDLDPHTKAKHDILRNYLSAWFPILANPRVSIPISPATRRIVYYDGFAGPGRYSSGETGSPLIALDVARNHTALLNAELVFVFVENDPQRAEHLRREIDELDLPSNFNCQVRNEDFETALSSTLDYIDENGLRLAPTFALIDPFGISGLPFSLIERLLGHEGTEVLITFMNMPLQRFPDRIPDRINELCGHPDAAAQLAKLNSAHARVLLARKLYEESLRRVARFVRLFEMRNSKNRHLYDLVFAGNHHLGHDRMKQAMWKLDGSGEFSFSDGKDRDQEVLFTAEPEKGLAVLLVRRFSGETVRSEVVKEYARDETIYLEKHATAALKLLEAQGGFEGRSIKVESIKADGKPRRKNTYPIGTTISFSGE